MRRAVLFLCWWLSAPTLAAEYPEIKRLHPDDRLFRQQQEDVRLFFEAEANNRPLPGLSIFRYRGKADDSLVALAARFQIPVETLATLNRADSNETALAGKDLLVANMPGLFVPARPRSELERLVASTRRRPSYPPVEVVVRGGAEEHRFYFFPGERFSSVERAFFLKIVFRFPVENGRLSSGYGMRVNPFSGEVHFHEGVDIAAPKGTKVIAARDGIVISRGFHRILGNYVVLRHSNGYNTVYGHLASFDVGVNDRVPAGGLLGRVGSTGQSTGPHLHFEVRREGQSLNPGTFLPRARSVE